MSKTITVEIQVSDNDYPDTLLIGTLLHKHVIYEITDITGEEVIDEFIIQDYKVIP